MNECSVGRVGYWGELAVRRNKCKSFSDCDITMSSGRLLLYYYIPANIIFSMTENSAMFVY